MEKSDKDWDEILASLQAVCEEPKEEQEALRGMRPPPGSYDCPVHTDCVYCEVCCADDPLGIVGPQG